MHGSNGIFLHKWGGGGGGDRTIFFGLAPRDHNVFILSISGNNGQSVDIEDTFRKREKRNIAIRILNSKNK